MKFTIQRKILVRLLKLVLLNPDLDRAHRDVFIRIAAHKMKVILKANMNEAGGPAIITNKGVAFIRYRRLLLVIQSFKHNKWLTVGIDSEGLHIGKLHVSEQIWWAIFDDPETAPQEFVSSKAALATMADLEKGPEELNQIAWRNYYLDHPDGFGG